MDRSERRAALVQEVSARTGIDETMIGRLVHAFYDRVRQDPTLGPIFNDAVDDWDRHLGRMCAFWHSVALSSGRYQGQPMAKHLPLPVDARHFDRWLSLFEATARDLCPPVAADHFIERARRIAESLELGVAGHAGVFLAKGERYYRDGRPGDDADDPIELASSPCLLHEIDPVYAGLTPEAAEPACEASRE